MGEFTKLKRGLQVLFPSSGTVVHEVTELRSDVQLVHPFPSQASDLESITRQTFGSASALTPFVTLPVQPPETYDEWIVAHVGHTFGGLTRVTVSLVENTGAALVLAIVAWDSTGPGFIPLYGGPQLQVPSVLAVRPIVVPPGWAIGIVGQTQAVAYTVSVGFLAARRPLADVPLFR